jgi:hypothetical protein
VCILQLNGGVNACELLVHKDVLHLYQWSCSLTLVHSTMQIDFLIAFSLVVMRKIPGISTQKL